MLGFFKKEASEPDLKQQAKALYEKVVSATSDSHEARKARLNLGMLCKAHLDMSFVAGAQETAVYVDLLTVALINGKDKPALPVAQEYLPVRLGAKTVWVYLPQVHADEAFNLGAQYQKTQIDAITAIASMQSLADKLCFGELKLEVPFVAVKFLRDEIADTPPDDDADTANN